MRGGVRSLRCLIAGSATLLPGAARSETRITGKAEAVRIEAREASLEEVLAALATKFSLRYRSKVPLGRRIHGTFAGSLSRVVSRLLDGYDHVVKRGPDGMEVLILGVSPKPSSPGESPFPRISRTGKRLGPS